MKGVYIFIGIYLFINLLISLWVYFKSKKFYDPAYFFVGDDLQKRKESLHEKYKEFKKNDQLSFLRILIGVIFIFWVKFILLILTTVILVIILSLISLCCKNNNNLMKLPIKIALNTVKFLLGVRTRERRVECSEEYKKYFGEDYEIKYDKDYSLMISNHTGWIDIACYLAKYQCGFIAKKEVSDIPLIGSVSKQINCLFVNREDANNRHNILELIKVRQEEFMANPQKMSPFIIFPEGTVTSGNHILKLKKGAFSSLLPIKPNIIKTNLYDPFHLSVGSAGLFPHFIRTLCYLYHDVEILELPVMAPTNHMYEYYSKKHPEFNEKWEIYSEVVRELYCTLGNFEKSEKSLQDSKDYSDIIHGRKKKNTLLKSTPGLDKSIDKFKQFTGD